MSLRDEIRDDNDALSETSPSMDITLERMRAVLGKRPLTFRVLSDGPSQNPKYVGKPEIRFSYGTSDLSITYTCVQGDDGSLYLAEVEGNNVDAFTLEKTYQAEKITELLKGMEKNIAMEG